MGGCQCNATDPVVSLHECGYGANAGANHKHKTGTQAI